MSYISQTYNCMVTWMIENFDVLLCQMGDSFCVPEAEVETLNHAKWTLTLKKLSGGGLKFSMQTAKTDASTLPETNVDFRVSFVGTNGSLHFSQISNGVKFGVDSTQVGIFLFSLDKLLEMRKLIFPTDIANLLVEMRFCDSNPLILRSTIRTKMKIERSSFSCSAKKFCEFQRGEIPSFPIDVHLERSPNFSLMFQPGHFIIHKSNDHENPSGNCDVLFQVDISMWNSNGKLPWRSAWLFFNSSTIDDKRRLPVPNIQCFGVHEVRFEFAFANGKYGTLLEQRDYSHPFCYTQTSDVGNNSHLGQLLLKEQKFVDITLKAGTESFKAHKAVLSSASPVFNAMFDHEMKERESGVVCIEDMEPDTLKRMLHFMYTDTIDSDASFEDIASLFEAADKYEIYSLKGQCSSRLISMLCAENVCRVLHLAYMHDDEEMQQASKKIFIKDPSKVLDSEEWKNFMENCIRGRAAKSSVSSFFNSHQLRRSVSKLGQKISKLSLSRR